MDRVGVVGLNWKRGGPELLARFTRSVEDRPDLLKALARDLGAREVFYLATCNRVEVGFVADRSDRVAGFRPRIFSSLAGAPPEPGEAERTFRAWGGEGAAEHLFLVAAGLDSAKVGETEVAGQFRQALLLSREAGLCGPRLELILSEALKVAAKVHTVTALNTGHTSLAEVALDQVRRCLATTPGRVALVGVSPMTERCGKSLAEEGASLLVVNRSPEPARQLAATLGGEARSLSDFQADPDPVVALVSATGAPDAVLPRATLERLAARAPNGRPPLLVDLAVPPDIDPADADAAGLPRFGMKEVLAEAGATREQHLAKAAEARTLVDEALVSLRRQMSKELLAPLISAIHRRYQETASEGLQRMFRRDLAGLGEAEREALSKWASTLARRFAHLPTEGLKGLSFEVGLSAVEAFLARGDAELLRQLDPERGD